MFRFIFRIGILIVLLSIAACNLTVQTAVQPISSSAPPSFDNSPHISTNTSVDDTGHESANNLAEPSAPTTGNNTAGVLVPPTGNPANVRPQPVNPPISNAPAPIGCTYTAYGIGAPHPVRTEPKLEAQQIGQADINLTFSVIAESELWYQIMLPDGRSGWLQRGTGAIDGQCGSLPFQAMRPPPPQDYCNLYLELSGTDLYTTADSLNVIGQVPDDVYLAVTTAASSGALQIRLADGSIGWIRLPLDELNRVQALHGPCETIFANVPPSEGS